MNFALKTRYFVSKTRNFVLKIMNFAGPSDFDQHVQVRGFVLKVMDGFFKLTMMDFSSKMMDFAQQKMQSIIKYEQRGELVPPIEAKLNQMLVETHGAEVSKNDEFLSKTRNCVSKTRDFVFKMMNFAVHGQLVEGPARPLGQRQRCGSMDGRH